ncbi:MAG TPA: trypsin-like peptidase domain-containing protein [Gaiellales bacterium]|nr:trypsin-like peptidase domain-containing protein [Gaiellales bacterium]
MSTRAALASAVVIALVAGIAGSALALALRDGGGERTTVTTVVRAGGGTSGFDPVALYAAARNGVVTIEATFGVGDQTAGSGFVVNVKRGLIVTASHVVARAATGSATVRATAVYIVLDDGTRADAKVLGYDLFEDTALLQVDPSNLGLRALPSGSARSLRVGQPVAVIGSPFENRASLSTGVVSQLDRQITARGVCFPTTGVVQTDAAVNPGNSGGPLLDGKGAVVGMVTAINPDAKGGVAYAVPMEGVREAYRAIATGTHVNYAWLGVAAATLTPQLADTLGIGVKHGALVQALSPGGAAERAGLQVGTHPLEVAGQTYPSDGDVIVGVGSRPVMGFRDLDRAIAAHRAGQSVELHVVRKGSKRVIPVRLLPRPASFAGCG